MGIEYKDIKQELWEDLVSWGPKDLASTILEIVEERAKEIGLLPALKQYGVGWWLTREDDDDEDEEPWALFADGGEPV